VGLDLLGRTDDGTLMIAERKYGSTLGQGG
jgi:hypothetical protein